MGRGANKRFGLTFIAFFLIVLISNCGTLDPKTGLRSYSGSMQSGVLESKTGIKYDVNYFPTKGLKKAPAVLLLPGAAVQNYFGNLPTKLNKAGFNVLVVTRYYMFDYWGSGGRSSKRKALAKRGGAIDLVKNETITSINFLRDQENVDPNRICILGSSMGSALGIMGMKEDGRIKTSVIVSPGRICGMGLFSYHIEKKILDEWKLLLIASHQDINPNGRSAVDCAESIAQYCPDSTITKKYLTGSLHGTKLLRNNYSLNNEIVQWLKSNL